jgi:hypothetical protein
MIFIHADRGRNHQIFQMFGVEIFSRKGFSSPANGVIFGLWLLIESCDYNVNKISPLQRIDAFCSNTTGTPYTGSSPTVARDAQRLRQAPGQAPRQRRPRQAVPAVAAPAVRHLTARRATWLVRRRPERLDQDEVAPLAQLHAQPSEVASAST